MHRAHRAENHSLRLSLSPFSGLSSFSPWLVPSCYKKVFPSTVSSSQGPFQPTGQELHADCTYGSARCRSRCVSPGGEDRGMGRTEGRGGSQLPGHRTLPVLAQQTRTLLRSQPVSKPRPALLCCQAIGSHRLQPKGWDKPSERPTLCSWRAGSCSPGSPELLLLSLLEKSSSSKPPSQHSRHHRYRCRLSTSFCTSSLPVLPGETRALLPRAAAGSAPSLCISKNRARPDGMEVPPPVPALAWHDRHHRTRGTVSGQEDGRASSPSSPVLVRGRLKTRHTISKGSWRWCPAPAWSC